ncbi:DUF362 domain-containing protein [Chloroflexia bacterium SDU3-3]|nr:DUF362 domain-containing protein [Chloroflexia bacterium SDU3-3]
MQAQVALIQGDDRYRNIVGALDALGEQASFATCRSVVIKPNFVSIDHPLATTHIDAVRAVLDVIRRSYAGPITIAEGAAITPTAQAFERFGYRALASEYRAALLDLNDDQTVPVQVYDRQLQPRTLRLARTIVESDMRISVGPPKTHDTVRVTLSLKNMIMGALVNRDAAGSAKRLPLPLPAIYLARMAARRVGVAAPTLTRLGLGEGSDKIAMHQGYPAMNLNLALLAPYVYPHLAVIDGFEAMEGEGPIHGDPVPWRVAMASADALAADTLAAWLMGFDPALVGYLRHCCAIGLGVGDLGQIATRGNVEPQSVRRSFRPHPADAQQQQWQLDDAESWLAPAAAMALSLGAS